MLLILIEILTQLRDNYQRIITTNT